MEFLSLFVLHYHVTIKFSDFLFPFVVIFGLVSSKLVWNGET